MVNETFMYNITQAIGNAFKNTIGISSDASIGFYIMGIILLMIFMYWIFSSGAGIWGLIVIIPPLIIIMAGLPGQEENSLGLLPTWVGAVVWLIVGAIWGLILLRFFGER